jgi:gas vesicle protein
MRIMSFFTTLGIGIVIGVLIAPRKGSDLRKSLKRKADDFGDAVEDANHKFKEFRN